MTAGMRTASLRRATALVLALVVSSCTVGPDYARPDAPAPAAWKELPPHKLAEPADALPRGAWWTLFGDPVLDDLEQQVAAANQTLRAAEANYRQARAAVGTARAGLYPTIDFSASGARARSRGSSGGGSAAAYTATADVQWEIDLWGRIRRLVESAEAARAASAADVETTRLSL